MDVTLFRIKGYISEAASKMDALPSSVGSKHRSLPHCLFLYCFVIAALKDTLGAGCCLQAIFFFLPQKKGLIFFCHFHFHHPFPTVMIVSFVFTRHSTPITVFIPRMKVCNESKVIAGIGELL